MEKQYDLTIVDEKSLNELVGRTEYSLTVFKKEVPHIRKLIGEAREVAKAMDKIAVIKSKLDRTIHDFNDDIVAKLKMGSIDEVMVMMNEIAYKVERLGERLTSQYQKVLDRHHKELLKTTEENARISEDFRRDLSSKIVDKVNEISISKIEEVIEADIKRRLGKFRFEDMDILLKVSDMEKHLKKRMRIYDNSFRQMEEQSRKMENMIEWHQEQTATLRIKYILGALVMGALVGYTNFFYLLG